jgi:hypothetical protein
MKAIYKDKKVKVKSLIYVEAQEIECTRDYKMWMDQFGDGRWTRKNALLQVCIEWKEKGNVVSKYVYANDVEFLGDVDISKSEDDIRKERWERRRGY